MAWQRFCTIDGMNKKHVVRLTQSARDELTALIAHGVGPARQLTHARILLKADQGPLGPGWTDAAIVGALEVSVPTIERVRQRYVTAGRAAALLHARPVRSRSRRLDGAGEAHLIALTCGTPPAGRTALDHAAAGRAARRTGRGARDLAPHGLAHAQKNDLKPWLREQWVIPPKANADFVFHMEDVLAVYTRPHDPRFPLVCLDELCKELRSDSRPGHPAQPGQPAHRDYEYVRNGTGNVFLSYEPLTNRRWVRTTARRTKCDWAETIQELVDVHYPDAERIVLVLDNLNTHSPASLYERFSPAEARRLTAKLEIHYTPKHGSWLNMAEIELSVLARQCLDRRIPNRDQLATEVTAWAEARNTTDGADRVALHHHRCPHQAQASLPSNPCVTDQSAVCRRQMLADCLPPRYRPVACPFVSRCVALPIGCWIRRPAFSARGDVRCFET